MRNFEIRHKKMFRLVLLLFVGVTSTYGALPSFIKVCSRSDPYPNECILDSLKTITPHLKNGIPELNVPTLEPLNLPPITISRESNGPYLKVSLKNTTVFGASNFIVTDLKSDLNSGYFQFNLTLPKLDVEGDFKIKLNLLLINYSGAGRIYINMTDYHAKMQIHGYKKVVDGVEYLQVKPIDMRIILGNNKIRLSGLFSNDQTLGEILNQAVNDNARLFFQEFRPTLEKTLSDIFTDVANAVLASASYEELFPA